MLVGSCVILGELFAMAATRKFASRLNLRAFPHRRYLAYAACGMAGAVAPLPLLGYIMERDILRLDPRESPQSAILHAQEGERQRQREIKKLGRDDQERIRKEREEYDWEEKEKVYVDVAEQVRREEAESKSDEL